MEVRNDGKIDFSRTIYEMKKHWKYYVISFVVCMALAVTYWFKKNPEYMFHANILIEQENGSSTGVGMMQVMRNFSMGSLGAGSVDDELLVLQSRSLLCDMVSELKLNRMYIAKEGIRNVPLYNDTPVKIMAPDAMFDTLGRGATFQIHLNVDSTIDLTVRKSRFKTIFEAENQKLPMTVALPTGGIFVLDKTTLFKNYVDRDIVAIVQGNNAIAEFYKDELMIDLASKKANGVSLELKDKHIDRGSDILNKMLELYNRRRLNEVNKRSENEVKFLDDRLALLTGELFEAEKKIEEYKTDNSFVDILEENKAVVSQSLMNNQSIVQNQTQLAVMDMICDFLENPENRYAMVPITNGVGFESVAKSIETYNELILRRMQLNLSAKQDNKNLILLNNQIDGMRSGVLETIRKARESSDIAYKQHLKENEKYMGRIRKMPNQEREFVRLFRDREIKNNLYMFLMEQRESSLLKVGSNLPKGRVVDAAYHDVKPVAPKKLIVFGIALVLAFLFPTILFVYRTLHAKKVIIKADINRLSNLPIAAQIAHKDSENDVEFMESIRGLRNALVKADVKSILVTSLFSEDGKTVISVNLAKAFASTMKRVAVVDFNGKLKAELSANGGRDLSEFVSNENMTMDNVIAHSAISDKIDVVSMAAMENADLLLSGRFNELYTALADKYDIVIVCSGALSEHSTMACLADKTDKVVLVIKSGQDRKQCEAALGKGLRLIDQDKAEFVLNDLQ